MGWQDRFYPRDVFVSLEKQIESLVLGGRFRSAEMVLEEIKAMGTPGLHSWAKSRPALFVPLTPETLLEAASIERRFPDLLDPKSLHQSADAYVIALAKLTENGVVVTEETRAKEKRKPAKKFYIPDVCDELGVPCIDLIKLMRQEKWTL